MSTTPRSNQSRSARTPLIAINAALLAILAGSTIVSHATGSQPTSRARGEYIVVGGDIGFGNANAIYVVDTTNEELVVLGWSEGTKQLRGIGYRDLQRDSIAMPER